MSPHGSVITIHNDTSKCQNCLKFLYNSDDKTILGKTASDWAKLLTYYVLFLVLLFVFFAFVLYTSLKSVDLYEKPFYPKLSLRILTSQAAISAFPIDYSNHLKPMSKNYVKYADIIQDKLSRYTPEGVKDCNSPNETVLKVFLSERLGIPRYLIQTSSDDNSNKTENVIHSSDSASIPCRFKISSLGTCANYPYGYQTNNPCFYLKINKVLDWNPIPYNLYSELPNQMPEDIKNKIKNDIIPKIWTHCEGANPHDKENLIKLDYFPGQSFDTHYFPYTKSPYYQSPLVAVQIYIAKNSTMLSLNCYLWQEEVDIVKINIKFVF